MIAPGSRLDTSTWPHPICDTHSHVDPDGSFDRNAREHRAGLDDYLQAARSLGVGRHVIVHSKAHRHDARCTPETIARIGVHRARGVVWEDPRWTDADLVRLHDAGVRGVRFLYSNGQSVDTVALKHAVQKIAPLGWHLLVQADGAAWTACVDELNVLPCAVVVDHMGRFGPEIGLQSSPFQALLRFLRNGGWVKLSAPYYATSDASADFRPLATRVHALVDAAPTRAIWGMNWPHVNLAADRRPDDAAVLGSLLSVLRSDLEARAVLAENAARLYGFAEATASSG